MASVGGLLGAFWAQSANAHEAGHLLLAPLGRCAWEGVEAEFEGAPNAAYVRVRVRGLSALLFRNAVRE